MSGRESGSLSWRLSRQETGAKQLRAEVEDGKDAAAIQAKTQLIPTPKEIAAKRFNLKYFPVKDGYQRELGDAESSSSSSSWDSLAYEKENLDMKVEIDWKMTYLARKPESGDRSGSVSWRLNLKGECRTVSYSVVQ